MTRTITLWLLAACAAGTLAAPAQAFVLCARGDDAPNEGASVKVRSVCKDNETALDPAALGVSSAPTIATVVRTGSPLGVNGLLSGLASCLAGEVATGGGVRTIAAGGGVPLIRASHPQPDAPGATPTGWRTSVQNISDGGTITATTFVVCASATP